MSRRPRPVRSSLPLLLIPAALYCGGSAPPAPAGGERQPASPRAAAPLEAPPQEQTTEPHASAALGAIQVKGETSDWYEVLQDGKRVHPAAPPVLNNTVEVPPGTYDVVVNKTRRTVRVEAGERLVLLTGTLVVEGRNANFYVPYQDNERKVAGNPRVLNAPMALFAGTYRVELNAGVRGRTVLSDSAQVVAGQKTVLRE